jgi:hypothetical protein
MPVCPYDFVEVGAVDFSENDPSGRIPALIRRWTISPVALRKTPGFMALVPLCCHPYPIPSGD